MSKIVTIFGWDAAWTENGSGAWCVVRGAVNGQRPKKLLHWEATPMCGEETIKRLRELLQETRPQLITIDMPIGVKEVTGYREADRETTRAFSRYGCPVHSPTPERPGRWGYRCMKDVISQGYEVCTQKKVPLKGVAEVYPHSALLYMLRLSYRFPYKVSRHRSLWPELNSEQSRAACRSQMKMIYQRLGREIGLPPWEEVMPHTKRLKELKSFEDRLDALICGWSGFQLLAGTFKPYGNKEAAIWNPDLNKLDPPVRTP